MAKSAAHGLHDYGLHDYIKNIEVSALRIIIDDRQRLAKVLAKWLTFRFDSIENRGLRRKNTANKDVKLTREPFESIGQVIYFSLTQK